jgi:hypothetical protein
MTTSNVASVPSPAGRMLLLLGLALPFLGILAYAVQIWAKRLSSPWYVPVAATLGVVCIAAALWQRRTVWRVIALVLVGLLAGAQWMLLATSRLPEYTGPVAAGQPFPEFTTARADGTPFTHRDLKGGRASVLVFFRGRW